MTFMLQSQSLFSPPLKSTDGWVPSSPPAAWVILLHVIPLMLGLGTLHPLPLPLSQVSSLMSWLHSTSPPLRLLS
jgi:hypothetical protein